MSFNSLALKGSIILAGLSLVVGMSDSAFAVEESQEKICLAGQLYQLDDQGELVLTEGQLLELKRRGGIVEVDGEPGIPREEEIEAYDAKRRDDLIAALVTELTEEDETLDLTSLAMVDIESAEEAWHAPTINRRGDQFLFVFYEGSLRDGMAHVFEKQQLIELRWDGNDVDLDEPKAILAGSLRELLIIATDEYSLEVMDFVSPGKESRALVVVSKIVSTSISH